MEKLEGVETFLSDLHTEQMNKDKIERENRDMEKVVKELEQYAQHLEQLANLGSEQEDNEWKTKFELQKCHVELLTDDRQWMEADLAELEWKVHQEDYPEVMKGDLDTLTEDELGRLVEQLEMIKRDYSNTILEADDKIEQETKQYHQFYDQRMRCKEQLQRTAELAEMREIETLRASQGMPQIGRRNLCGKLLMKPQKKESLSRSKSSPTQLRQKIERVKFVQ